MSLKDKVVIVTGAATHIGQAYAVRLAQEGAKVVACDILDCGTTAEMVMEAGGEVLPLITDVTKEEDTLEMARQTVERFGRIDCIVNNAGIFDGLTARPMMDVDMAEWDRVYEVNVKGMFLCCRAVFPYMKEQGGGKIINIGSMTSIFGSDWVASYAASKGGVVQLTKSLAIAWAKDGIQVNAILPGWIHTDLTAAIKDQNPERYAFVTSRIPRGRWGEPDELAGAAVFLASRASDYVTGVSIPVDGGYSSF